MKGQICKFRKWNESKMADVNWGEDDAVLGLFADNSYEEADFMGFLLQYMNAVPLSDFVPEHNTIYRPISRQGGPVMKHKTSDAHESNNFQKSFRKIKTKNKNPTYLSIFFRSIIWEPENFFCMA